MFELNDKSKDHEMAIMAETRQEPLLGSIRRRPGLFIFEYNPADNTVEKVNFEDSMASFNGGETRHKIKVTKGRKYCQALNLKNAIKKFKKQGLPL